MKCPNCTSTQTYQAGTTMVKGREILCRDYKCEDCEHIFEVTPKFIMVVRCVKCNRPLANVAGFKEANFEIEATCEGCKECLP